MFMLTFLILAAVMIVGALGVILLKQPVHAALSLVGTLLTLAVVYVTLEAHFLAAIQVIVYAGAIMVLFLFVIMLLNVQGDNKLAFRWMRPAAYGVGLLAMLGLLLSIFRNPSQLPDLSVVQNALQGGGAAAVAEVLFSEFVLAFQLVGVLLLTGIIGAVSLVQRKAEMVYQPQAALAGSARNAASAGAVAVLEPAQDDLKRIKGVGPKLEKLLHKNGIFTFEELAGLSQGELEKLDTQLEEFKGRIWRDDWLSQAKRLAEEKRHA
jgi:NADH-quinone oxidoreductase subunit J